MAKVNDDTEDVPEDAGEIGLYEKQKGVLTGVAQNKNYLCTFCRKFYKGGRGIWPFCKSESEFLKKSVGLCRIFYKKYINNF